MKEAKGKALAGARLLGPPPLIILPRTPLVITSSHHQLLGYGNRFLPVESVHSRNEQRLRLPDVWDILIGGDRLQSLVPDPCEDAEFSPSTDKVRTPERRAESRFVRTTCCRSTSDEQSSTKAPERHLCFTAEQQTLRAVTIPPSPLRAPTAVLDCPVCDKPALVRLDKHLQDAHYINAEVFDMSFPIYQTFLIHFRLITEVNEAMYIGSDLEADGPEVQLLHRPPKKKIFPLVAGPPPLMYKPLHTPSTSPNLPPMDRPPPPLSLPPPLLCVTRPPPPVGLVTAVLCLLLLTQNKGITRVRLRHGKTPATLTFLIQFQNLSSRVDRIESVLDRLVNAQASTSRAPSTPSISGTPGKHATPRAQIGTAAGGIPCKLGLSAQKNEHVTKLENPCNLFQRLVSDYQSHRLGPRTARKDLENARQAASHALRFCLYMGAGISPKVTSRDLRFLLQTHKLRTWPLYLAQKGYAPTTVKNMMNNVILFIKHVECNFRSASKLKVADFQKLQYEMMTLQSELHKHVVVHRQKVLKKKTQALPGDGDGGQEHCHLMGYLMGYLTILTGHRSIVLVNMTCEHVFQADSWSGGRKCRILAKTHLTEKERKQVAQAMCHDPATAEKFYVALPDKNMGYETRNLRLKALKEAAATSISLDDPGDSDDEVSVLSDGSSDGKTEMSLDEEVSPKSLPSDEPSDYTPDSSSEDGEPMKEPIYSDTPDSSSSLSSGERFVWIRQRKDERGAQEEEAEDPQEIVPPTPLAADEGTQEEEAEDPQDIVPPTPLAADEGTQEEEAEDPQDIVPPTPLAADEGTQEEEAEDPQDAVKTDYLRFDDDAEGVFRMKTRFMEESMGVCGFEVNFGRRLPGGAWWERPERAGYKTIIVLIPLDWALNNLRILQIHYTTLLSDFNPPPHNPLAFQVASKWAQKRYDTKLTPEVLDQAASIFSLTSNISNVSRQ
ncbi:uncharacterized protein V6R79_016410 [Siganus canaliculatus]